MTDTPHDSPGNDRPHTMPGMLGRLQAAWFLLLDPDAPILGKLGVLLIGAGGLMLMLAYGLWPIDLVPELFTGPWHHRRRPVRPRRALAAEPVHAPQDRGKPAQQVPQAEGLTGLTAGPRPLSAPADLPQESAWDFPL